MAILFPFLSAIGNVGADIVFAVVSQKFRLGGECVACFVQSGLFYSFAGEMPGHDGKAGHDGTVVRIADKQDNFGKICPALRLSIVCSISALTASLSRLASILS